MRFTAAALALSLSAAAAEFSVPACERPGSDEYVFGVSGAANNGTDDFGRINLIALSAGAAHSSLFAARPSTSSARQYVGSFQNPLAATAVLERMSKRPETNVRIILTGHGSPDGVYLGVGADENERRLDHATFIRAVEEARRAGKPVKADLLSCFAGSFMPAFMPGPDLAPSCAIASTLPEKMAEGCYQDASTAQRDDYAAVAASLDDCKPGRDWRDIHAGVFERLKSYDIPMLSSDYFLLYGPAAQYLAWVPSAPYPPRTLVRRVLSDGMIVYLDLINARVVAARGPKGLLPPPSVSIVDCRTNLPTEETVVDGSHRSGFYLHRTVAETGWPAPDCVPKVLLQWKPGVANSVVVAMTALPEDTAWGPGKTLDHDQAKFMEDLTLEQREVPIAGLKPGVGLLLTRLLPAFKDTLDGRDLAKALKTLALEVEARDPVRGRSMRALLTAMWVKDGARQGVTDGTRFHSRWLRTYLTELYNETETNVDNLDYSRLSFLVATAIAERDLRAFAKANFGDAQRLVADLEALRACEKTFR